MIVKTTNQNMWNATKAVIREKFIDLNAIRKEERFEINDLSIYFEKLEEEIKTKLIRAGINAIENKKFKQKVGSLTNHYQH